jgi:hypothetical protein
MRGDERVQDGMFSYVSLEQRVPQDHPLRAVRKLTDAVLQTLSPEFDALYAVKHFLEVLDELARLKVEYFGREAQGNTELEIEYEKILARKEDTRVCHSHDRPALRSRQGNIASGMRR